MVLWSWESVDGNIYCFYCYRKYVKIFLLSKFCSIFELVSISTVYVEILKDNDQF